jgi:ADP-ribose pyrophosphatase
MAKTVFEGKHVLVVESDGWEYVERIKGKSAVAIIAVTEDGKLVLTEQRRRPVDARVLDLPAGLVGDEGDEDEPATAHKELEEETGYVCDSVEWIARYPTSPGITSEIVSVYRAKNVRRAGEGGGVGGEEIVVHAVELNELTEWLAMKTADGMMVDPKVWIAMLFLALST